MARAKGLVQDPGSPLGTSGHHVVFSAARN